MIVKIEKMNYQQPKEEKVKEEQANKKAITIQEDYLIYEINEENRTASIIDNVHIIGNILIPESIKYQNQEYKVTSIIEYSFKYSDIKSIKFSENSALRIIEKKAFFGSHLENIFIPTSVSELREGWCAKTPNLINVTIDPNNQYFKNYEKNNKIIIGRSKANQDEYDQLIFASRDLTSIDIPPNIRTISSFAFSELSIKEIFIPSHVTDIRSNAFSFSQLQRLQIGPNSELQMIGKKIFAFSRIESISIPSSLTVLEDGWCSQTPRLTEIKVTVNEKQNILYFEDKAILGKSDKNSDVFDVLFFVKRDIESFDIPKNIKFISNYAFSDSSIEAIDIPSSVTHIGSYAFAFCEQLESIEIPQNSELKTIGKYAFYGSLIESISIPSSVVSIEKFAFYSCSELKRVEISKDSKISIINENVFSETKIDSIFIPDSVKQICIQAFADCNDLKNVEIGNDSELQIIEKEAFANSLIECISIPASVSELSEGWCLNTPHLFNVAIMPNNKYFKNYNDNVKIVIGRSDPNDEQYNNLVFVGRDIEHVDIPPNIKKISPFAFSQSSITEIFIPPHVTHICKNAFYLCNKLRKVEIPTNSELSFIGDSSFFDTSIESIYIPSHVKVISKYTFFECKRLKCIEFADDSELQEIKCAFSDTSIENLMIPSQVSKLDDDWCNGMKNIKKVTIMSNNMYFKNFEGNEKVIIGKSSLDNNEYDILVFVGRDITHFDIPPNIKIISPYAFAQSSITEVFIHPNVTHICDKAFYSCRKLRRVEIPTNSELVSIGLNVFSGSSIESISIPSKVTQISFYALTSCYKLRIIQFDAYIDPESITKKIFLNGKRVDFMIPAK